MKKYRANKKAAQTLLQQITSPITVTKKPVTTFFDGEQLDALSLKMDNARLKRENESLKKEFDRLAEQSKFYDIDLRQERRLRAQAEQAHGMIADAMCKMEEKLEKTKKRNVTKNNGNVSGLKDQ